MKLNLLSLLLIVLLFVKQRQTSEYSCIDRNAPNFKNPDENNLWQSIFTPNSICKPSCDSSKKLSNGLCPNGLECCYEKPWKCDGNATILNKRYPPERDLQSGVVMIWPSSKRIWGHIWDGIINDVANLANTISKYEPLIMLVNPDQVLHAENYLGHNVTVIPMESDEMWPRDILPVFMENLDNGDGYAINFNFCGWGYKQTNVKDSKISYKLCKHFNWTCIDAGLIGEPGGLETDGAGTLIVTESSWVCNIRNPGKSRDDIEEIFKNLFGIKKVIWIKGIKLYDITDSHIDAVVRFPSPGIALLGKPFKFDPKNDWSLQWKDAKEVLARETDARGQKLKVIEITEPNPDLIRSTGKNNGNFLTSYLNVLVINGAVIMPQYGDIEADKSAQKTIRKVYPNRDIVPVSIDYLAMGGGGIHCATHDVTGALKFHSLKGQ